MKYLLMLIGLVTLIGCDSNSGGYVAKKIDDALAEGKAYNDSIKRANDSILEYKEQTTPIPLFVKAGGQCRYVNSIVSVTLWQIDGRCPDTIDANNFFKVKSSIIYVDGKDTTHATVVMKKKK